jgi:hypothetical protein
MRKWKKGTTLRLLRQRQRDGRDYRLMPNGTLGLDLGPPLYSGPVVYETVTSGCTDVALPNGDVIRTPTLCTLTLRAGTEADDH